MGWRSLNFQARPRTFLTKVPQHASLPANLTSFPATQPDAAKPDLPDEGSMPIPRPCKIGKELDKALAIGFGPEGASAQVPKSFLSDREIFRRTVLRGKAHVSFGDLSLRKIEKQDDGKSRKTTVSKEVWEEVMSAGFQRYPVGKLENRGTAKSLVTFSAVPDDEPSRLQFHEWLVQACEVSVRLWVDALTKQQTRAQERAAKRRKGEDEEAELQD